MPRKIDRNSSSRTESYLQFLSKWFIMLNTGLWLLIIVIIKLSDLRTNYADSATDGFIILVGWAALVVYSKKVQKYLERMDLVRLFNLALIIGYIHFSLNIIDYPILNWLRKTT